jgi:hypothetical protein
VTRGCENGAQFVPFLNQWLQLAGGYDLAINQHIKPKHALVRLFHYDTNLSDPFCFRPRSTSSPIVCRHCRAASKQLFTQNLRVRPQRQRTVQANNSDRKRLGALAKLLRRNHQGLENYKLPDYQITNSMR